MTRFNFRTKINITRPNDETTSSEIKSTAFESDRGRIINSAAIRRLQQKTQVFPLERNAAVRSRLTHSLEVQQVGRFIARQVSYWLDREETVEKDELQSLLPVMESVVEMACLMHDIGNPPFGHFGEKAIADWFSSNVELIFKAQDKAPAELTAVLQRDISNFEGNAQAIRLIHSLLKLNLTYTQTAAILKYTRPAYEEYDSQHSEHNMLKKKPGYYLSEQPFIEEMQKILEMDPGCRHPLCYIMEAADDISYCLADIEDAVEKKILTVPDLTKLITESYLSLGKDPAAEEHFYFRKRISLTDILNKAFQKYADEDIDKNNQFFIELRVYLHHILVNYAARQFNENLESIFHGTYNSSLLNEGSSAHCLSEAFKTVAFKEVFSHPEVEMQELRGHRIIQGLLDIYKPLLILSEDEFSNLLSRNKKMMRKLPLETRLLNKLPGKHIRAYLAAIEDAKNDSPTLYLSAWEKYYRCRLLQDYISGMTDQFAYDEYKRLTVKD
ncbi:dGTPase [Photobacterium sp. CCB-ST2H9]|uniref:dGTPase n=1 Tax=Photobacterium sp. CCB-ST2H9 TaxID=2912855 RepID=UPI0020066FD3|nr:dGTPase [Photobacterium sp. CCB-ST2H9]UTM59875.1 dGTPase [Photobacterium sp. CCB-ST2H9]